jgi:16S rRNA (uracil1498-N3)-methyltransferase
MDQKTMLFFCPPFSVFRPPDSLTHPPHLNYQKFMNRLYLSLTLSPHGELTLPDSAHHYLAHVMRAQGGECLEVFDNQTGTYTAHILRTTRKETVIHVGDCVKPLEAILPPLTLAFALVKKPALERILEKATELGVTALQPLITQRTVMRSWNAERALAQVIEAAEQTERNSLPTLHPPKTLEAFLHARQGQNDALLVGDERGASPRMMDVLSGLPPYPSYTVMVGPEGGWTQEELDKILRSDHCRGMSMGSRILRADTAAIAGLSVCRAWLGDW